MFLNSGFCSSMLVLPKGNIFWAERGKFGFVALYLHYRAIQEASPCSLCSVVCRHRCQCIDVYMCVIWKILQYESFI